MFNDSVQAHWYCIAGNYLSLLQTFAELLVSRTLHVVYITTGQKNLCLR